MTGARDELAAIRTFPQLVRYLRDELDWPVTSNDFEDLVFDYDAQDLGIDARSAAKIQEIKRLRPLSTNQPWGIFFVKFEPKRLPVVALRRILSGVALKKRASANSPDHAAWAVSDLLFISNYGEGDARQISFAHFSETQEKGGLPTLRVLGWDNLDTPLHLDDVAETLARNLNWPGDEEDEAAWQLRWEAAFTLGYREVISTSRDMALRLAALARVIRDRISGALAIETDRGPLTQLMKAVQSSLVHDLDAHGFADMYAQTIAYGLLSARIADPDSVNAGDLASHMRTNPLLRDLMQMFLHVGGNSRSAGGPGIDFDELGVSEVVELLSTKNMAAVLRDFGDRNPEDDPVIHFYELFLKEYDERQRMQRGVFYTPRPVVSYIVRSVDQLLKEDFGLVDGLADLATWADLAARQPGLAIPEGVSPSEPFVQVLDPATGTGTFLVEVIDLVHQTMTEKWRLQGVSQAAIEGLWNEYVPNHLLPRLHGFELLMAPYAIAHLKVGLKLFETGYRFGGHERARIFLTNALEPPRDYSDRLEFAVPALAEESRAVSEIKRTLHFTVVIGNPPWAIHSGNLTTEARALVDRYRSCDGAPIRERGALQFEKNLQNDYVKFIRLAEIAVQHSTCGVVGYVTSHAFLTNRTLRGMRESLADTFPDLRVLNLHGNANSGEASSLSSEDQNVFEITEGVAIGLFARPAAAMGGGVAYSEIAGTRSFKYGWLLSHSEDSTDWQIAEIVPPTRTFKPSTAGQAFFDTGVPLDLIFGQRSAGAITARDDFATDPDREVLVARAESFALSPLSGRQLREAFDIKDKIGWDVDVARRQARDAMPLRDVVRPYAYRPFDSRFIAYNRGIVWGMAYPTFRHTLRDDNLVLVAMQQYQYDVPDYPYAFVTRGITDSRIFVSKTGVATVFPLYLDPPENTLGLTNDRETNLSPSFLGDMLGRISAFPEPVSKVSPEAIFGYIYALLHSPSYRIQFAEPLKSSFPRIFRPASAGLFDALSRKGLDLVSIHLLESPLVLTGPAHYEGPSGPVVGRVSWSGDTVLLDGSLGHLGSGPAAGRFRAVSADVWNFNIGGYQVCDKWLKDRRGRSLTANEIAHYERIIRAISETIRTMGEIDEAIDAHGGWPGAFIEGGG